jgi:uridine kinase
LEESIELKPKPIIILEGIFSFYKSEIRELLDYKIFIDTPADIRILRRAKRDINKRGRSIESIFSQYIKTVSPMHKKFVEPTKTYADIIVMDGGKNKMALDIINNKLLPIIKDTIDAHS